MDYEDGEPPTPCCDATLTEAQLKRVVLPGAAGLPASAMTLERLESYRVEVLTMFPLLSITPIVVSP